MRTLKYLKNGIIYLSTLILIFWTFAPYYWLVMSSLQKHSDLLSYPINWIPKEIYLMNYMQIFMSQELIFRGIKISPAAPLFLGSMLNSFIIATCTTAMCLLLGALAGYIFARTNFPGRRALFFLIIGIQLLPPIAIIIPLYFMMMNLRLIDTHICLILLDTGVNLPWAIWVMHSFFKELGKELEEAAYVDGCSRIDALFKVVLPVSKPGLVAAGILCFLFTWDEFMFALTFTQMKAKTVTLAISEFSTQYGIEYGMMCTGGVLASIPPIIVSILFQKWLIKGLTAGAIKG